MTQESCISSACAVSTTGTDDDNTDDFFGLGTTTPFSTAYATTCPNALAAGTITSGFAIGTATFASTDSTCKTTPTSVDYVPVGVCYLDTSPSDGTVMGSVMLTADSNNNILFSFYANPDITCSSTPTVQMAQQESCTCLPDR